MPLAPDEGRQATAAVALPPGIEVIHAPGHSPDHHVVWDNELSTRARTHLDRLGYSDLVRFHVGEAVETLQHTGGPFDLIFNDINKRDYPASIDVIQPKLRSGGVLIIDNLLWSGRILDPADETPDTEGVRAVTSRIMESDDWIASIVPIRDGVLVAYKR